MKAVILWPVLAAFYALAIFIGSAIPAPDLPRVVTDVSDKVLHLSEYAVFGFLIHRALRVQPWFPRLAARAVAVSLLISVVYGASDEIHQIFVPGRSADILDWIADSCGALAGMGFSMIVMRWSSTTTSHSTPGA